jgi:hypothetical protein
MKVKAAIAFLSFLAGYIACTFLTGTKNNTSSYDFTRTDTVFVAIHDTIRSKPKPVQYIPVPVPVEVDTAAIIAGYFSQRIFEDVQTIGNNSVITILDTVSQNGISGRSIFYDLNYPVITKTVKPVYSLSVMADTRLAASVVFGYKNLDIQAGYDFGRKETFAGFGIKLFEK